MYQGRFSTGSGSEQPQQSAGKQTVKKPKRQPSLGGTIFYTLYFLFIILFCAGTLMGLKWLDGWLTDFEVSQPTAKAAAVFNQLFGSPKWEDLYISAGIPSSRFETPEIFAEYMKAHAADQSLSYAESSDSVSGEKTYDILLGTEKIAAFTLENHNTSIKITAIPDWQLGDVELFLNQNLSYRILMPSGYTAKVNGVALGDSDILQITTTAADAYLPSGVTAPRVCTLAVEGLFAVPEVAIFDKDGNPVEVSYDADTCTFEDSSITRSIPEDLKQVALDASEYQALWIANQANDEATLKTYFLEGTDCYNALLAAAENPAQDSTWEITEAVVSDYVRYDEEHFSVRVERNLSVTSSGGAVKDWPYSKSMLFQKQSGGNWLCILSDNFHLSEPVGRVRLTFMRDDIPVSSDFYYTDSKEIITPIINAPEGKVFAGWVRKITDEEGNTTLDLVFPPNSTGRVAIPEGQYLTPMTLYAHFENLG